MNAAENRLQPAVSVVTPVYNSALYLQDSIESIVHQTLEEIEIICVNDGSTDDSPAILEACAGKDPRIRILHQANRGLSEARNAGAKLAKGKYLFFFDSDDLLEKDALSAVCGRMEAQALDLCCFNAAAFGEEETTAVRAAYLNDTYFRRVLSEQVCTGAELLTRHLEERIYNSPVMTYMLNRQFFTEHELWFYPGILHEDEPWTFRALLSAGRAGCVSRILYHYRIRPNSIMTSEESFAHCYGCFKGSQLIADCIAENFQTLSAEPQRIKTLIRHELRIQGNAIDHYRALPEEEKEKRHLLPDRELMDFERLVVYPALLKDGAEKEDAETADSHRRMLEAENQQLNHVLMNCQQELAAVKQSRAYRTGRKIMWLPHRLKTALLFGAHTMGQRHPDLARKVKKAAGRMLSQQEKQAEKNTVTLYPSVVEGRTIRYRYHFTGPWEKYFRQKEELSIIYPFAPETVPESVRIIPFLSQILPVAWRADAEILVSACDQDFYDAVPEIRNGYRKMYPSLSFSGKLTAEKTEKNIPPERKSPVIACYSGGIDATGTVITHLAERPLLVSLWGSDIPFSEEAEWETLYRIIRGNAESFSLELAVIRSAFRDLVREDMLEELTLRNGHGWWYDFQHGLGILGHMAPAAWQYGAEKVLIASSFTALDTVTCASAPEIDNQVRYCGAQAVHDGFDKNRQDKIRTIVEYRKKQKPVDIHVCWLYRGGNNCCHCEKCWRTMLGLIVEGEDPKDYGFTDYAGLADFGRDMEKALKTSTRYFHSNYFPIQDRLRELYRPEDCPEELKWFYHADLKAVETGRAVLQDGEVKEKVWLLMTPEHGNMGDQLITDSEIQYLNRILPHAAVEEITVNDLLLDFEGQISRIDRNAMVFLQGGGNLGSLWTDEEDLRQRILNRLENRRMIIFPQSIFFSDDPQGRQMLNKARKVYNREHFVLCCRDPQSLDFARKHFTCRSLLIPDMVLWKRRRPVHRYERAGAMTLFRSDKEKALNEETRKDAEQLLIACYLSLERSDTVTPIRVNKENRDAEINSLLDRIAAAKIVVTDRLHGMILCAVTGTLCIAFNNSYSKVKAGYDWIRDLEYIHFCSGLAEKEKDLIRRYAGEYRYEYPEEQMQKKYQELEDVILSEAKE